MFYRQQSQVACYIYELKVSEQNVVSLNVIHLLKVSSIWRTLNTGLILNANSLFKNSFPLYYEIMNAMLLESNCLVLSELNLLGMLELLKLNI